jgi:hypothetical protein
MSAPRKSRRFGGSGIPQGAPSMDLEIYDQVFRVRGQVAGVKLLNVMKALDSNSTAGADESEIDVIMDFLEFCFLAEDREAAMKYLAEADDPPVDMPMLVEILQWLIGEYTGNPTEQPAGSEDGSSNAGTGSLEKSAPVEAPISEPSTLTNSGQSAQLV